MYVQTEIIVLFFLISFFIYTMPMVLVKFSKTLKGKFLLLVLTIVITLYNKTGGLLMAMLIIFLSEFNYEVNNGILYEGFDATGPSATGPSATGATGPTGPTGPTKETDDTDLTKKKWKVDLLTISEQLKPANTAAVSHTS
jgi:hypothetical protein